VKRALSALVAALGALGLVLAADSPVGASATVLPAGTAITLDSAGIALKIPADGRVRGFQFAAVVGGVGFAQRAGPADDAVRAPPGDELCVIQLSVDHVNELEGGTDSEEVPGPTGAVVVGGVSTPIEVDEEPNAGPQIFAAAVPVGSSPLLELTDAGLTQDFSLRQLTRTGTVPTVLYRDGMGPDLDVSGSPALTLQGTTSDGTSVAVGATLAASLTYFSPTEATEIHAGTSGAFLLVQPTVAQIAGTDPNFQDFQALPPGSVQLTLPDGTVVPAQEVNTQLLLLGGSYVFAVPGDTTTATLDVHGGVIYAEEAPPPASTGGLTQITFSPTSAVFTFTTAPFVAAPGSTPSTTTPKPRASQPSRATRRATKAKAAGIPLATGAGAGGVVIIIVVLILIPVRRRRYPYGRASRQGVLVVYAPPLVSRPPAALPAAPLPTAAIPVPPVTEPRSVEVRVVGPIELVGLLKPTGRRAVDELLVYLALHPGQVFSAEELRSRIWAYPRRERADKDFRNLLYYLKKALPPGAIETTDVGPKLTELVSSDWGQLSSLADEGGETKTEKFTAALILVRGHPFADVRGRGDDNPYDWAYRERLAPEMEATVERLAHELAMAMMEDDDTEHARWAIDRGLRCVPESILLYGDLLRVGAARDGVVGIERAMAEARRVLGDDAASLEDLAGQLGGD
jgi:hypothetical protein